jgi:hypothetical protein
MAKKVELEGLYNCYCQWCESVARAEAARDFRAAVQQAEASLPLVHSAVTFQRRFLKLDNLITPIIDCVLRYAPPLFLRKALDAVEKWYADGTRTERNALPDMPDRFAAARQTLAVAADLWSSLSARPGAGVHIDNRLPAVTRIIPVWLSAGLIVETNQAGRREYARAGDSRRPVRGKCSECGGIRAAPLAQLLDPARCPTCGQMRQYVIISRFN